MGDRIAVDIDGGIADVRLSRADKMNALDERMFQELLTVGERLKHEKGVRVVVLSGEGDAFCAGIDVSLLGQLGGTQRSALAERSGGATNGFQQSVWEWHELPVPVIAALHGVVFGGGFQLALGADLRISAPDTRFSIMEARWGLVPDMTGTLLMRNLARDDVIRELTYTARIFSAQEALSYGFVTRITENPRADALTVAGEIARQSPDAVRAAKRLLNKATEHAATGDVLAGESREQEALLGSSNHREAVQASKERRPAKFSD